MDFLEELKSQFEVINAQNVDIKVLENCNHLCTTYSIDPEDFIDQWLAYSASNSLGLVPTLEALDKMERYELKKQQKSSMMNTPKLSHATTEKAAVMTPTRQNLQKEMMQGSPAHKQVDECTSYNLPSESFCNRSDAGSIVLSCGDAENAFKQSSNRSIHIKIGNSDMDKKYYMYEKFLSKRASLNEISRWIINEIRQHHELVLSQERLQQFSGEMVICGRISSEGTGKLDQNSLALEGLIDLYKGQMIKLKLNKIEKFRLFNGQSVILTGNNMKDWFSVSEVFAGAPLPSSPNPEDLNDTLQIVVAAGPFTLQQNLLYEPLEQLLKHVADSKPNVLILMGPFLNRNHPHLEEMNESYDSFFESIIDGVMHGLQGTGVQVVLVPSEKDIHSDGIFPTHPYKLRKRHENLHLSPNPFMLNIDGVIISGSTPDILFHLSKNELSKGVYEDRISSIISHLFNQRSFYPLHPPDPEVRVDYQLIEQFGMFESSPHVMILPSNFRYFVKTVQDCVVINPERLSKGNDGTFVKIEVRATPKDQRICERISCRIQRV